MVKLSQKNRKILKRVFRGLIVTAVFFIFQACYGMPSNAASSNTASSEATLPNEASSHAAPSDVAFPNVASSVVALPNELPPVVVSDIFIHGSVRSRNTRAPIPGIKVSIDEGAYEELTTGSGRFYLYPHSQDTYTLTFEDIDGPENGGLFKQYTQIITLDEAGAPLTIYLDEDG